MLFLCTVKTHYLQHMAKATINPAKVWNYSGEDLMQKIKRVAASSVAGNAPQMAHNKVMAKYVVVLHCLLDISL